MSPDKTRIAFLNAPQPMTNIQKTISVSFLTLESLLFNAIFCDWKFDFDQYWAGRSPDQSLLIQSFGPFGIHARDHQTLAIDMVLGIAVPVAFIAAALLIYTTKPFVPAKTSENVSPQI